MHFSDDPPTYNREHLALYHHNDVNHELFRQPAGSMERIEEELTRLVEVGYPVPPIELSGEDWFRLFYETANLPLIKHWWLTTKKHPFANETLALAARLGDTDFERLLLSTRKFSKRALFEAAVEACRSMRAPILNMLLHHGVNLSYTPRGAYPLMHHLYFEIKKRYSRYASEQEWRRLQTVKRSPVREVLRIIVLHAADCPKIEDFVKPEALLDWFVSRKGDVDITRFLINSGHGSWADVAWSVLSEWEWLGHGQLRCGRLVLEELGRQGKDKSVLLLELLHRGLSEGKGHMLQLAATLGAGILEGEALREMVEGICYSCRLSPLFAYLRAGLSPNFCVRQSFTLPMYAAFCGHLKLLRYLHSLGADVLAADEYGDTPLHWACISGQNKVIRWLLDEAGADGTQADTYGRTPLDILMADHSDIRNEPMAPLRRIYLLNKWKRNRREAISMLSRL